MATIEERVTTLETILGEFILHTDMAITKLAKAVEDLNEEMRLFIEEMREFKEEMREFKDEMLAFKNEMKEFKDEMLAFKNEMKEFKDEMLAFKNEMKEFKDEMLAFKNEMKEFKDDMLVFKDEMDTFKDNVEKENKRKNKEWSDLAKKMGTILEDLIYPALIPVIEKYFKCKVTKKVKNLESKLNGENYEVDAVCFAEKVIFFVEVKSTSQSAYVDEIINKSKNFFKFFPEFEGKELVLIYGGIIFGEDVINYASKKGVYLMGWKEWEYMDILNFDLINKS